MEHAIKKIGILTSGGDAPGMNAAIYAIVKAGLKRRVPSSYRQRKHKRSEHDEKTLVRTGRPCAADERGVRRWRKPVRG